VPGVPVTSYSYKLRFDESFCYAMFSLNSQLFVIQELSFGYAYKLLHGNEIAILRLRSGTEAIAELMSVANYNSNLNYKGKLRLRSVASPICALKYNSEPLLSVVEAYYLPSDPGFLSVAEGQFLQCKEACY